ncbi:zinc metalloproteinase dpy-31-like [Saccostrea cucullata]|uniref:zinc metalloproteinase dpy-31-like n=1 Tax=Saccostrea cuccullata TaxID=36930 RepID=UPI002ED318AF
MKCILNNVATGCGSTDLSATYYWRAFNTPGYFGQGSYSSRADCTWKFTAPPGKRVRLQFVGSFGFPCWRICWDFVEVRFRSLSNTGPRYCCGTRPTRVFTSDSRVMVVLFRRFSNSVAKGFRAMFKYV